MLEPLPAIPGGWEDKTITVGGREFIITLPADPDAFLDDPDVQAAHARDEYMPYWPYLWPASYSMAEAIFRAEWIHGTPTLEIGAGIGFVGLAALARGLRVTFSDYAVDSVQLALHNARQNGFQEACGISLDWRAPTSVQYSVIFGCDVVYDTANHRPILNLLDKMLAGDGVCWLGDAGRQHGGAFWKLAREWGWHVELWDAAGRHLGEPIVGAFQLMVLRRSV
jgi:hypothetical protein